MKLGGEQLTELFRGATWRAYRGETLMSWAEIEPLIGPNSIDVTLGSRFLRPQLAFGHQAVDPRDPLSLNWEEVYVPLGDSLTLHPGVFVLASVRERFICEEPVRCFSECMPTGAGRPDLVGHKGLFAPMYEGRSSCGRLGIASHITAGFGDYGFGGAFTLEMFSHFPHPVKLYSGMRIGQVAFDEVYKPKPYNGAYAGANHNAGPVPPVLGYNRF